MQGGGQGEKRGGRVSESKMLTPGCSLAADRQRTWAAFWVAIKSLYTEWSFTLLKLRCIAASQRRHLVVHSVSHTHALVTTERRSRVCIYVLIYYECANAQATELKVMSGGYEYLRKGQEKVLELKEIMFNSQPHLGWRVPECLSFYKRFHCTGGV